MTLSHSIQTMLFLCSVALGAITEIAGTIADTNLIWEDTISVTDDIYLSSGDTLVIKPGTRVEFQDNYRFTVHGLLRAEGTAADTILFTVADTTGFNCATNAPDSIRNLGGWGGIHFTDFNGEDSTIIDYCKFEYIKKLLGGSYTYDSDGGIYFSGGTKIRISNSLFENNRASDGAALYLYGNQLVENNEFRNNRVHSYTGGAIYVNNGSAPIIRGNSFHHNETRLDGFSSAGGAIYIKSSTVKLYDNLFYNNKSAKGGAVYVSGCAKGEIINNRFHNNYATLGAGAITFGDTYGVYSHLVAGNIFTNNAADENCGAVEADNGYAISFVNNTVAYNFSDSSYTFSNREAVRISGSSSKRALLTNNLFWENISGINRTEKHFLFGNGSKGIEFQGSNSQFSSPFDSEPDYYGSRDEGEYDFTFAPVDDYAMNRGMSDVADSGIDLQIAAYFDSVDIMGNPRIYGDGIDFGAIENQTVITPIAAFNAENRAVQLVQSGSRSFTIESSSFEESRVRLFDLRGRAIFEQTVKANRAFAVPAAVGAGLYVLSFSTETGKNTVAVKLK